MTSWYSNHFTREDITVASALVADPRWRAPAGESRAHERYTRAAVDLAAVSTALTVGDQIRLFAMRSGDQITALDLTWIQATATALEVDFGIYEAGLNHDGPAIDPTLFADGHILHTGDRNRINIFTIATLRFSDFGKPLWELAGLSADPKADWDLVMTIDTADTVTDAESGIIEMKHVNELGT